MRRFTPLIIVCFALSGCGSLAYRTNQPAYVRPGLYPGVRLDAHVLSQDSQGSGDWSPVWLNEMVKLCSLLDMPFSFLVDTLLIPFDLSPENSESEGERDNPLKGDTLK